MPVLAPIVGALSGVLVSAGIPLAAATFAAQVIVTVGLAVGSAVLSKLLSPTQKPPGQEFEAKAGANVPGWCIYGRQKVAGQIMPPVQLANSVVHVRNLGLGWHDALEFIIVDGQRLRLVGVEGQWSNSGVPFVGIGGMAVPPPETAPQVGDPPFTPGIQATGPGGSDWYQTVEFGSNLRIKFYDGRPTQTADPYLTANGQQDAQGNKHWTAAHAGNSVCRVLVEITPDTNKNLSANPQLEFIVRGRRLWDPRKDPVYGGTGSHSRSDMSTWEWSDNCALAATDYRLGLWLNGVKVLGIGTPIARIRMDSRIAAANVCDTPRPLLDDAEEPMWRIAAVISNDRTHRDNLQIFMDAMAGWETERGGTYRLTAGGPQTPAAAIGDGDLAKAPARYRAQKPLSERYNGVEGKFADPFNAYELQDLPLRLSSADEAADMGERRLLPMTLSQVPSETQAQHLMEIARRRQRLQASATITLPPRLRDPEIMDTIVWSSAWHGGEAREFMIQNPWRKNRDMTVTWGLVETSAAIWDWDPETDQLSRLVAADLPSAVERLNTVAGFAVSANHEVGEGGQKQPVFLVSWTPIADQTVDAVLVRYRPVGATEWAQKRFDTEAVLFGGSGKIDGPIQADTPYEFEADLITTPQRFTEIVAPAPVTSDTNLVVKKAVVTETVEPGGITWPSFNVDVQGGLEAAHQRTADYRDLLDQLAAQVQGVEEQARDNRATVARRVEAVSGQASARLLETYTVLASADAATAATVTSLSAQVNHVTSGLPATRATLLSFQSTQATLNTAVASDITSLNAALTTLGGTVSGQASAISALDARVTSTEGVNTSQASQLTSLDARLTSAEGVNGGQATAISGLDARVTSAEGVNTSQASSITSLESRMTSAEGVNSSQGSTIAAQGSAISGIDTRVTAAEGTISSQGASIVSLNSSLSAANGTITANSAAITSLNSQVTSINGTLGSQASSITSLNASVGSLNATVTTIANATIGPSGASALHAILLNVAGRISGIKNLNTGGTSALAFQADQITFNRPSDGAVVLGWDAINLVLSIFGGTFEAGLIKSTDGRFVIDLANKLLTIKDPSGNIVLRMGYY